MTKREITYKVPEKEMHRRVSGLLTLRQQKRLMQILRNLNLIEDQVVLYWPDGTPRDPRDIESDPQGKLIVQPGGRLEAAHEN